MSSNSPHEARHAIPKGHIIPARFVARSGSSLFLPALFHSMNKKRLKREAEHEERITNEIIVDCYNEYEGWTGGIATSKRPYRSPSRPSAIKARKMSPLKPGESVTVLRIF